MEPTSVMVKILEQIRDGIGETNAKIDQTNARIDQTNVRLDQTNVRLETGLGALADRITGVEGRLATGILAMSGKLDDVKTLFADRLGLRDRLERCEHDIHELQVKIGAK